MPPSPHLNCGQKSFLTLAIIETIQECALQEFIISHYIQRHVMLEEEEAKNPNKFYWLMLVGFQHSVPLNRRIRTCISHIFRFLSHSKASQGRERSMINFLRTWASFDTGRRLRSLSKRPFYNLPSEQLSLRIDARRGKTSLNTS